MSDDITRRAEQSMQRSMHALEVHMMTAPVPTTMSELYRWGLQLCRDVTFAVNPVMWQVALESLARSLEANPSTLKLEPEQVAEVVRWIRAIPPMDGLDDEPTGTNPPTSG